MHRHLWLLLSLLLGCDAGPVGVAVTDDEALTDLDCAKKLTGWCQDFDGDGRGTNEGIHPPMEICNGDMADSLDSLTSLRYPEEGGNCGDGGKNCYENSCDDCDDNNKNVNTDVVECDHPSDAADNDCDATTDALPDEVVYYADEDADGYGDDDSATSISICEPQPEGTVLVPGDCNDAPLLGGASEYPGADEGVCSDGIDQDCDGEDAACALLRNVDISGVRFELFEGASAAVALGDADNDGHADFALGFPGQDVVEVYYGGDLTTLEIQGGFGTKFGASLAVGDFDNNEYIDLAVGASTVASTASTGEGAVFVILGPEFSEVENTVTSVKGDSKLGASLVAWPELGAGLSATFCYEDRADLVSSVVTLDNPMTTTSTKDVSTVGSYPESEWPTSIATDEEGSLLGVGYSESTDDTGPGLSIYDLPSPDTATLTLRDAVGASSALGASVAFGALSDTTSLVLIGAPGAGNVYMLTNLSDLSGVDDPSYQVSALPDGALTWTASTAGSAVALIGDVNSTVTNPGEAELAIGGYDTLWILAQSGGSFTEGKLDDVAAGVISGFGGYIRHIVNAGDVDGDGYEDLLVSTDDPTDETDETDTTWLLYGGFAHTAGDDTADTGG